ncbi:ankyrin repeat-containing domain protein [Trichoderma compactum]
MASNGESSRQGHAYGPTTVDNSHIHQGDNIYLSNESPRKTIDCREALLLKDPFIYRESLKNDKGERASGTCEWIRDNEIYRSWLNGDKHCLWICGGPGKELERKQLNGELDQDTTLLGLAYQLLSKHSDISTSVLPYFETEKHTENTLSSAETLWMVLKTLLRAPQLSTVYCILDGLDECDEKSIGKLVKQFRDFYSTSASTGPIAQNLKLAIVSRKINGLEDFPQIRLDSDNDNLINEDIKRFISTAMQELSRRSGYDNDFLREVENILLRRSKGTFLWIGFVMKELLDMSTRMEVMDALNALPQGLPAMYGRMLRQIKSSQRHIISTILRCVTMARRPMTLEELKTAVALLCNTPIDSTQAILDRIVSCGPILQTSDEQVRCSLVHQSARDYLLREEEDEDPILEQFRIKAKEAHAGLARICLACIENSDFRYKPLDITDASVLKKSPLLGYATMHWPEHARHAGEDLDSSQIFFQKKDDVWKHWWQTYRDALGWGISQGIGTRSLLIASYLGIDSLVRKMLQANTWRIDLKFRKYVDQRNFYQMTPLILAAGEGHHSVVQLLLANGADVNGNANAKDRTWDITALEVASRRGHLSVIQLLLDNGADAKLPGYDRALNYAAESGHAAIVQLLLTKHEGIDVNSVTTSVRLGALYHASYQGSKAIIQLLLTAGADANIKNTRRLWDRSTALSQAAGRGHEAIVRLLLANGVDAKLEDKALYEAARNRHEAIVQLLLDNGAANKNYVFNNALAAAASGGQEAIVRLLLATLEIAAKRGRTTTVQFLLANGARNVSTKDKFSRTALEWAVKKGHEDIVQLLLANGVGRADLIKALRLAMRRRDRGAVVRILKSAGKL